MIIKIFWHDKINIFFIISKIKYWQITEFKYKFATKTCQTLWQHILDIFVWLMGNWHHQIVDSMNWVAILSSSCDQVAYFGQNIHGVRLAWCTWDASFVSSRRRDFWVRATNSGTKLSHMNKWEDCLQIRVKIIIVI